MSNYSLVLFKRDDFAGSARLADGLTLEEAQAVCKDERTHGEGWFIGFSSDTSARKSRSKKLHRLLISVFMAHGISLDKLH